MWILFNQTGSNTFHPRTLKGLRLGSLSGGVCICVRLWYNALSQFEYIPTILLQQVLARFLFSTPAQSNLCKPSRHWLSIHLQGSWLCCSAILNQFFRQLCNLWGPVFKTSIYISWNACTWNQQYTPVSRDRVHPYPRTLLFTVLMKLTGQSLQVRALAGQLFSKM